ncbi:hypothetical protein JCM10213_001403 [Rhodosporidiobolus nylandii]
MSPLLLELPAAFRTLNLESAGSPAPWTTAPVSGPLRHRVLLAALSSLSLALAESSEQRNILATALASTAEAYSLQREACVAAKGAVLKSSKEAQAAHGEAKRVEKLNGVFREGADRTVAALDRKVLRTLRKGKMKDLEGALVPLAFVEELIVDLDLVEGEVLLQAKGVELDEEWKAIEDDLVRTMAARAVQKASPRPSSFRFPGEERDDDAVEAISLPPTPPASVHSSDFELEEEEEEPEEPTEDALIALLPPLVHPILVLLFHLHQTISTLLSTSIDRFEELVRLSAAAVDTHRQALQKTNKTAAKLRDLRELQRREIEEEEKVMEELRTTVVELARLALRRNPEDDCSEDD